MLFLVGAASHHTESVVQKRNTIPMDYIYLKNFNSPCAISISTINDTELDSKDVSNMAHLCGFRIRLGSVGYPCVVSESSDMVLASDRGHVQWRFFY